MTTKLQFPRIIAFNGPPRSGKDTIANVLATRLENTYTSVIVRSQLSLPMRLAVCAMLGIEYSEFTYERIKDQVQEITGETFRQTMIRLSEEHVKPAYGNDIWVKSAMARAMVELPHIVVISDLGFPEEINYLESTYAEVLVVQIDRDGSTWDNDSRVPCTGRHSMELDNNTTIRAAVAAVVAHCDAVNWAWF